MRLRSTGIVLLALMLCGVRTGSAQVTTTGSIQVILEDPQGGRLPGVAIQVSAPDVVTSRIGVTDGEGIAILEALTPSTQYVVTAQLTGFRDLERTAILVRSGQVTTLRLEMTLSTVNEQVTVRAPLTPLVDTTRALSGTDLTLRFTESLPTGRSYQSYLQLVPGVMPDSQNVSGNPSSRSGVNWKDQQSGDNIGLSGDNFYYFEGINVTDPVTGGFGGNLNTEIIQEQKVITGGIPAEYVGAPGLISTVVTKSGTNRYSGSYNYFFQNDGLVTANENNPDNTFSSVDTAFTLGGPLVRDKLWAFGSFRYLKNTRDVNAQDTRALLRTVDTTEKQSFFKATYAPNQRNLLSFMFLNDPYERTGSVDTSVVNNRDRVRKQGGENYSATFSRIWDRLLVEASYNHHENEITDLALDRSTRNTIAYQRDTPRTLADEQLGGFGQDAPEFRNGRQARVTAQYQFGMHRVKGGYEWGRRDDIRDLLFVPAADRSQYTSIASLYGSVSAASIANSGLWSTRAFDVTNPSDFAGLLASMNAAPNRASFYGMYDTDGNGAITAPELSQALMFSSTAGNPNGQLNYYRMTMTQTGKQSQKLRSDSLYVQDDIRFGRLNVNVGVRTERWQHFSTTNASLFTFDWTMAPRLSAVYDLTGDGRQKVAAFWGRYYDPIRMDTTNYAGTVSGSTREEQVFINNQWLTYRVLGVSSTAGLFAPNTKTPYTDELQLQYERDLGRNMSASVTYYNRHTRDIFEDINLPSYADPARYVGFDGAGDVNAPNSLFLGYDYFGFDPNNPPSAGFVLGTLKGGKRDFNGLELVFRKRYSNNWQGLFSYNYLDAKGNAVSDGNADFAGDQYFFDPRAPNMFGTLPGTVHHLVKAAGSYTLKWGIELGGAYRWNSGTIVNRTFLVQGRRLPVLGPQYTFGGVRVPWVDPSSVGAVQNPSWGQFDLRLQHVHRFQRITTELFLDVFNVFDNQGATRFEDLAAGSGATPFGGAIAWLNPRRAFVGVRARF
ncbi:MAG: carboxypeptidase regulatory-like domain-containing protein [Vicinamibacterales bacterium]